MSHILISIITISTTREIESIEININNNLLMYQITEEKQIQMKMVVFFFVNLRKIFMINPVNIRCVYNN